MSNARVPAAAEGMSTEGHPGLRNFPTTVDQLGTNYLRTDKAPANATEAHAQAKPLPRRETLEDLIDTARMSAKVANYLAVHFIGSRDGSGSVRLTDGQADLLLYATGRAVSDTENANAAFLNDTYPGSGE